MEKVLLIGRRSKANGNMTQAAKLWESVCERFTTKRVTARLEQVHGSRFNGYFVARVACRVDWQAEERLPYKSENKVASFFLISEKFVR